MLLTVVFAFLLLRRVPALVWAGAQAFFPSKKANGSLLMDKDGVVRRVDALLAQNFSSDKYFQPRASAAGTGWRCDQFGGTNLGPTSQKLSDSFKAAVAACPHVQRPGGRRACPSRCGDVVKQRTRPHISVANAMIQGARVARARELPLETVRGLMASNTDGRTTWVFPRRPVSDVLKVKIWPWMPKMPRGSGRNRPMPMVQEIDRPRFLPYLLVALAAFLLGMALGRRSAPCATRGPPESPWPAANPPHPRSLQP